MKESIYNHFIENGNSIICFNAYKDSYMVMGKSLFKEFNMLRNDLYSLEKSNEKLFKVLKDNGIIIPDNLNERDTFISQQVERRFSGRSYHIILNMTMDCNLRCWYCYEDHIENSRLSEEVISSLIKHIERKSNVNPFQTLILSFFGGEPLLYKNKILEILNQVKEISVKKGFSLNANFTTNATLIDKEFLLSLKELKVSFQITIDGWKDIHNKIRKYKNSERTSYDKIINSLKLIRDTLLNYQIVLRINISPITINGISKLLPDIIKVLDPSKSSVSIYKVWQVKKDMVNEDIINNFVKECQLQGLVCSYLNMGFCLSGCYADNFNQVVINYDGLIYKCTARKFEKKNAYGYLNSDGMIVWDSSKLINRMSLKLPDRCLNCNILPVCPKPCSQTLLENSEVVCILNSNFTKEDYIIQMLNNKLIQKKLRYEK